jgi:hypothetical protein
MEKDPTRDSSKVDDIKAEVERKNEEMFEQEQMGDKLQKDELTGYDEDVAESFPASDSPAP